MRTTKDSNRNLACRFVDHTFTHLQVGAGIQVPPNSAKLLERWGVMKHLAKNAVQPEYINFRRWQNGEIIGVTDLSPEFSAQYGAPYYVVHRAHLHTALYERALELGINVRLNSKVVAYDPGTASITQSDGSEFQGDLVVAADGMCIDMGHSPELRLTV